MIANIQDGFITGGSITARDISATALGWRCKQCGRGIGWLGRAIDLFVGCAWRGCNLNGKK